TPSWNGRVRRTRCWGFSSPSAWSSPDGEPMRNSPAGIRASLTPIEFVSTRGARVASWARAGGKTEGRASASAPSERGAAYRSNRLNERVRLIAGGSPTQTKRGETSAGEGQRHDATEWIYSQGLICGK